MQLTEISVDEEIEAEKEIIQSTEGDLSKVPYAIKSAEALIKSCDDHLFQVSQHIEQQRQSLKIAAVQLHDTTVAYNAACDYLDSAAGKTGENAAVYDLKVKKEQYDAAKLSYQKEQQMYDQSLARNTDLQKEYGEKRTEAQSFIDQKHKQRGSLQSAHNQAVQRLGGLLYQKAHDKIASLIASLEYEKQAVINLESDLRELVQNEAETLNRWPDLQSTILHMLPYTDSCTSVLERYRALLELLLQERHRCNIEPQDVPSWHNFDMRLLLELPPHAINDVLTDPQYGVSPRLIEEKLQDIEKLLLVYRQQH